jgi:dethiobiotin synthetase
VKRFLVVTGTDTGVGKTTISVALLAAWLKLGKRVRPLKPIETGLTERCDGSDAARLAAAVGCPDDQVSHLRFQSPVAPEAAAAAEGHPIDPVQLVEYCRAVPGDHVLIEGAGGLLVPIAPGFVIADLAQALGARLLLVGRTRLGTINHTLLTLAESQRRGLPIGGVILNRLSDEQGPEETDNARLIARHGGVEPLGPFPFCPDPSPTSLAELAQRHLPVATLFERAFSDRG